MDFHSTLKHADHAGSDQLEPAVCVQQHRRIGSQTEHRKITRHERRRPSQLVGRCLLGLSSDV